MNDSRTFANQILVSWTPNFNQELAVDIKVGGQLYKALNFDGTSSQDFSVQSPPNTIAGKFIATFYADGKSGQLDSDTFTWDLAGQKSFFNGGTIGLWQEQELQREMLVTTGNALTTQGSRTFGGVITVEWTPDFFDPSISVKIKSGSNLLKVMTFATSDTQTFNVSQGTTVSTSGKFTAVFNAGGLTGTLTANQFMWDINGQEGSFQGDIGTW
jgi:hypothetical protein